MRSFDTIFTGSLDTVAPLTAEAELDLIRAAQAGDDDAKLDLLHAYAPALRGAVRRYRDALDVDEARAEAVLAFLQLVDSFDTSKGERLAQLIGSTLTRALSAAGMQQSSAFEISPRTLQKFYAALRNNGGDPQLALDNLAGEEIGRDTFLAVLSIMRGTESLSARMAEVGPGEEPASYPLGGKAELDAAAEDRILVEAAVDAVNDLERLVCFMAYGFVGYDAMPDAEIAHELAGPSRQTVQRVRSSALAKMRTRLGVDA